MYNCMFFLHFHRSYYYLIQPCYKKATREIGHQVCSSRSTRPPSLLQPQRSALQPAQPQRSALQPAQPQRSAPIWQPNNLPQRRNIVILLAFFIYWVFCSMAFKQVPLFTFFRICVAVNQQQPQQWYYCHRLHSYNNNKTCIFYNLFTSILYIIPYFTKTYYDNNILVLFFCEVCTLVKA